MVSIKSSCWGMLLWVSSLCSAEHSESLTEFTNLAQTRGIIQSWAKLPDDKLHSTLQAFKAGLPDVLSSMRQSSAYQPDLFGYLLEWQAALRWFPQQVNDAPCEDIRAFLEYDFRRPMKELGQGTQDSWRIFQQLCE